MVIPCKLNVSDFWQMLYKSAPPPHKKNLIVNLSSEARKATTRFATVH